MHPWYGWEPWGWGMMVVMAVSWLLLLAGLAWVIWWGYTRAGGQRPLLSGGPESALDILQKRFARGEITREQYREMRQELEGREGPAAP